MKTPFNCGYVVNPKDATFANAGCFALADGPPFFDFAVLAAANINADSSGTAQLSLNDQIAYTLQNTGTVKSMQSQGITVLLCVLGNWQNAGWSCFTDYPSAQAFAQQLASCVSQYGLDGIDIDDEYSQCATNNTSLIMVTSALKALLPAGKIISKALWQDEQYFSASWEGKTLAQQLSYGWEMSYGSGGTQQRLAPYLGWGMTKAQLALGVQSGEGDTGSLAQDVLSNGYGGMMLYTANNNDSQTIDTLNAISTVFYTESTAVTTGCWTS